MAEIVLGVVFLVFAIAAFFIAFVAVLAAEWAGHGDERRGTYSLAITAAVIGAVCLGITIRLFTA